MIKFNKSAIRGGVPSKSDETARRFVGFSENVGHQMTYIILTEETNNIIYHSRVKLAALQPNKSNGIQGDQKMILLTTTGPHLLSQLTMVI